MLNGFLLKHIKHKMAPENSLSLLHTQNPKARRTRRYFLELDENLEALIELRKKAHKGRLTLVYASKEERYNNAAALKEYLETRLQLEE